MRLLSATNLHICIQWQIDTNFYRCSYDKALNESDFQKSVNQPITPSANQSSSEHQSFRVPYFVFQCFTLRTHINSYYNVVHECYISHVTCNHLTSNACNLIIGTELETSSTKFSGGLFYCHPLNWGQPHGLLRPSELFAIFTPTSALTWCMSSKW